MSEVITKILSENWIMLAQTGGIIGAFLVAYRQSRIMVKSNRLQAWAQIISSHRDLWKSWLDNPKLARILEKDVSFNNQPITAVEERFVVMVINNLAFAYFASVEGLVPISKEDELDTKMFFNLPIPKKVWENTKQFRTKRFVEYVENIMKS